MPGTRYVQHVRNEANAIRCGHDREIHRGTACPPVLRVGLDRVGAIVVYATLPLRRGLLLLRLVDRVIVSSEAGIFRRNW